jgi:hypothetical protein
MNTQKSILSNVIDHIFGRKYYLNVVNVLGTAECEVCCYIFTTKQEADEHRRDLRDNRTLKFVETISFRSRLSYYNNRRKW